MSIVMGSKKRGNIRWFINMWIFAFLIIYLLYLVLIRLVNTLCLKLKY